MKGTPEQRLMAKIRRDDSGCWIWTASQDSHGYGQFSYLGRPRKAYRVAYELLVGPVPRGLQLDHLCRVRACVNPAHLEPVTQAENIRRGESRATIVMRTGACERGHDAALRVPNGPGKTRCGACRAERRAAA